MTHVVAGFPSITESEQIVEMMDKVGANVIELQIPFSDPVADGPTMMKCNELSLERGFRVSEAFAMAKRLSKKVSAKLLFMTYFNILFKKGIAEFCHEAKESGICGLIVPDMPIEEEPTEHLIEQCQKNDICWVPVVSPITPEKRIKRLAEVADEFWYVVSRTGVTGAQNDFSRSAEEQISLIRKSSDLPISLAFGVSKKEHIEEIGKTADMAVVGSAVQNIFLQDKNDFAQNLAEAQKYLKSLC
jgi:tryptophan synthase alpha chain